MKKYIQPEVVEYVVSCETVMTSPTYSDVNTGDDKGKGVNDGSDAGGSLSGSYRTNLWGDN